MHRVFVHPHASGHAQICLSESMSHRKLYVVCHRQKNEIMWVTSAALHSRKVMDHYHAHLTILFENEKQQRHKSCGMIKSAAPSAGDHCSKTAECQKNQRCFKTSEKPLRGGARQVLSDWESHIDQLYSGTEPEDASDTFNARKVHVPFVHTVC